MIEAIDVSTMPVADRVRRHLGAAYYAVQLDAMQREAQRHGYFFAKADTAVSIPPTVIDHMAYALEERRQAYLRPRADNLVYLAEETYNAGGAHVTLNAILDALAALGVRPQAGVGAFIEDATPSDAKVSKLVNDFFAKLEDGPTA